MWESGRRRRALFQGLCESPPERFHKTFTQTVIVPTSTAELGNLKRCRPLIDGGRLSKIGAKIPTTSGRRQDTLDLVPAQIYRFGGSLTAWYIISLVFAVLSRAIRILAAKLPA